MPVPLKYKDFNDKIWLQIFFHDLSSKKEYFNNIDSLYFYDENKPNKFSILINITDNLKIEDRFEFLIEYTEQDFVEWKQKYNPLFEEEDPKKKAVEGYEFIDGIEDSEFGGLSRTTIDLDGCTPSLLNGYVNIVNWYYAIGMYSAEYCYGSYDHSYLPGIKRNAYLSVSLWLRVLSRYSFKLTAKQNITCKKKRICFIYSHILICIIL